MQGRMIPGVGAGIAALVGCGLPLTAFAGGGPENVLLIVDPANQESLYIANYYRSARNIPDSHILYINPDAASYAWFNNLNRTAVFGELERRDLEDIIDYIVIAANDAFFVPATGYVTDGCSPVTRFGLSTAYHSLFLADEILGGVNVSIQNRYFSTTDLARGFDSETTWFGGEPSDDPNARRYFLGATLGYTGLRGNTVDEIKTMIDRSVAADGARPDGRFYYQETRDEARSGPRDGLYDAAVATIIALGGNAEHNCCNPIPVGRNDVLGLMTGEDTVDILNSTYTLEPGAFCDHLTSWAATFDIASQTKMSEWITKGASGTYGTVEEPCNYSAKFPNPRMHVYYYQGLSLGESVYRSLAWVPFQGLVYGDPITRPWAYIPEVTVVDPPTGSVAGRIDLRPQAMTNDPRARIDGYDLLIDGVVVSSIDRGQEFRIDTRRLSDGVHDLRVLAYDDSLVRSVGRWIGELEVDNHGRSGELAVTPAIGDLSTAFDITVTPAGGVVNEIRLFANGRIVASTTTPQDPMTVYGATVGAGEVDFVAEIEFSDGEVARTPVGAVTIDFDNGSPSAAAPIAYDYTATLLPGVSSVISLPGTFDDADETLDFRILNPPTQSRVEPGLTGASYRVITPFDTATGAEELSYRVTTTGGQSADGVITLVYGNCAGAGPELSVGPLRGGNNGTFVVNCAYPREATYLAYSLDGVGSTYVPQLGVTLDLENPQQAAPPRDSNRSGTVRWDIRVPPVNRSRLVWFQAAQLGTVSNVVATQIDP
ncbi:MAG: TIGR03790 family protein [Phycisphaerales bacterium]